jgi:hypothetical protein
VQTCGLAASSRILSIFSIIRCGFTNLAHNAWERACRNCDSQTVVGPTNFLFLTV